jgi:hypothetical protein
MKHAGVVQLDNSLDQIEEEHSSKANSGKIQGQSMKAKKDSNDSLKLATN